MTMGANSPYPIRCSCMFLPHHCGSRVQGSSALILRYVKGVLHQQKPGQPSSGCLQDTMLPMTNRSRAGYSFACSVPESGVSEIPCLPGKLRQFAHECTADVRYMYACVFLLCFVCFLCVFLRILLCAWQRRRPADDGLPATHVSRSFRLSE